VNDEKQISVLIVDDEPLARDTLRLLLEETEDFVIVGECADGLDAVATIREMNPDLVFLDVQMPGLTGFQVVAEVGAESMPAVVFATAYDEYAVKAFETSAVDYLVKPYTDERFESTLQRVRETFEKKRFASLESSLRDLLTQTATQRPGGQNPSRFIIKEHGSIRFVEADDVEWVESAGDYVILHADGKKHMIRETMGAMETKLDASKFVRIHRSTIVNISCIRELKSYFHGDYLAYLKDGTELKLSRRYWSKVESLLGS
jgi:two-component system LytT family response regulator